MIKKRIGLYLSLGILVIISFFPLYWLLVTSFKPTAKLFEVPPKLFVLKPTLEHYIDAFSSQPYASYYISSTIVALITMGIAIVAGMMIAYALSRLTFKGKPIILFFIMATSMFPPMSLLLPIFTTYRDLGLLNSYFGLSMTHAVFALPMATFLMTALLKRIPKELEEAAVIDGATKLQAFVRVILPLSMPALSAGAILIFVYSWNEFLYAFTLMSEPKNQTLPVGIMMYPGEYEFPWGTISAAIVMSVVPLILLILFFQKRLLEGLTSGALKG
ncbi:MAG TPA: carbohydrate ABC transporter permease [Pseudogracilibacillus sp.]|nr:carbohydrate ABC transporter permease [Pseudogracilibacillus sp.]